MKTKYEFLTGFIIGFLIALILFLISFLIFLLTNLDSKDIDIDIYDNEFFDCSNMSLINTTYCLVDFVNDFYKYNKTDDKINLDLKELMERGGDCKNYADFYSFNLEKYGFKSKKIRFFVSEDEETKIFHAVIIAYDSEGYCILSLNHADCYSYI